MNGSRKTFVLAALSIAFLGLTAAFLFDAWGRPAKPSFIPLVDTNFLDTATVRESYAKLAAKGADLSDFDCYACHDKEKPPPLRFDENHKLIIPKEHSDIEMGHGRHD